MAGEPAEAHIEAWHQFNPQIWSYLDPSTTANAITTNGEHKCYHMSLAANETGRVWETYTQEASPVLFGSDSMNKRYFMKCWMKFSNITNIDQSLSFFGLSTSNVATRTTNNIAGFYLNSSECATIVDEAGTEQTGTHTAYNPNTWELFEVGISEDKITFKINNETVNTFATTTLTGPLYPNFFMDTNASGAANFWLGKYKRFFSTDVTSPLQEIIDNTNSANSATKSINNTVVANNKLLKKINSTTKLTKKNTDRLK